ncbi:uncharacterized protein LOC124118768 [Haliotis rufescens]|uniref:uncharacterized protein LOC124118768 n=1 Tax=Haliotis rufescens TaxID=6454 RepID=UPI00201ECD3E|nr:uncharacterized protein LOC124118768 [Haliotis rufescens]
MRHLFVLATLAIVNVMAAGDRDSFDENVEMLGDGNLDAEFDAWITSEEKQAKSGEASVEYKEGQNNHGKDSGDDVRDDEEEDNWKARGATRGNVRDDREDRRLDIGKRRGNGRGRWPSKEVTMVKKHSYQESNCPRDFVYIAKLKFCFKAIHEKGCMYTAKRRCRGMVQGGRLVQPDTSDKLKELTKYTNSLKHMTRTGFNIGAMKLFSVYKWMDGSEMKYSNWCPGSPERGHMCVKLISQREDEGTCMDDDCCFRPVYFICEKPIL